MKFFHKILLVMLGVGLIPISLMSWKTLTLMQERLLGEALTAREVRANSISGELQIFFENLERKLNGFVFNRNIEDLNVDSLQSICDLVLSQNPEIEIMSILDESGQERLGRSRQQVSGYGERVSPKVLFDHLHTLTPDFLQKARDQGMALGPIDLRSERPSVTMAIPYPTNNSDWYGLIAVRFSLKRIQQILSGGGAEYKEVNVLSFLLDSESQAPIFGPFKHSKDSLSSFLPKQNDFRTLVKKNGKAAVITSNGGGELIAVTRALDDVNWSIYSFETSDHALASALFLRSMVFFLFGIILILVMVMAYVFASHLIKPIKVIEKAAREYAEGHFDYRFSVSGKDEIAELGHSFQGMAGQISNFMGKEVDNARREAELKVAQAVQKTLISDQFPKIPGIDIHGYYQPSSEAGGDWYGLVHVPDEKAYLFMLGDVTGHGAGAALVTSAANTFFKALEQWITLAGVSTEPDQVLKDLNQVLYRSTKGGMAMTMFVYKYFPDTGRLIYSNAGQSTPFQRIHANDTKKRLVPLKMRGTPLGYAEDSVYKKAETMVSPGDFVIMYSDGIVECENPEGEDFGKKRFKKLLEGYQGERCSDFLDAMTRQAFDFYDGVHPEDDITILMMRLLPPPKASVWPEELQNLQSKCPDILLHSIEDESALPQNVKNLGRHILLGQNFKMKSLLPAFPDDLPEGMILIQGDDSGHASEFLQMSSDLFLEGIRSNTKEDSHIAISSSEGWENIAESLLQPHQDLLHHRFKDNAIFVITELLMNAFFDAPVNEDGTRPFMGMPRDSVFDLPNGQSVKIRLFLSEAFLTVQVEDPFGSLQGESVIRYLKKCLIKDEDQMDKKVGGAGLGIFLCWKRSSALFYDIYPDEKTIATVSFPTKKGRSHKDKRTLGIHTRKKI